MSIEAMAHVLAVPLGGTPKVVLLGLANHADAQFENARPAVGTLAAYANCDRRTVQRTLRRLEEDGWIEKTGSYPVAGRADRSVAVWRIAGRKIAAPQVNGAALVVERGGTGVANGAAPVPPEPSIEPSLNRERSAREIEIVPPPPPLPDRADECARLLDEGGVVLLDAYFLVSLVEQHPDVDFAEVARAVVRRHRQGGLTAPANYLRAIVDSDSPPKRKAPLRTTSGPGKYDRRAIREEPAA